MTAEILFPEVCNLYGDLQNINYLTRSCPEINVIETDLQTKPKFLSEDIDLVYIGSSTEKGLQLAVRALSAYRDEFLEKIEKGQLILATGNALDLFVQYVKSDDGLYFDGLGIIDAYCDYHMLNRHNSFFLGNFENADENIKIVGFKSLFGHVYGNLTEKALFHTLRGVGRNPNTPLEGIHYNNLLLTHIIGPLLILNPPFTKYILKKMGVAEPTLAFEEAAFDSYNQRIQEFEQPSRNTIYQ